MRLLSFAFGIGLVLGAAQCAAAANSVTAPDKKSSPDGTATGHIEVTADKSLEWYQDQRLYVARGNAKAVRGETTIEADVLTAHERDDDEKADNADKKKSTDENAAPPTPAPAPAFGKKAEAKPGGFGGNGDIDKMTAEGNVRVTTPTAHITGEHGVYDLNQHVSYVTGNNVKYQTEKDTVTAKDSLEYWEDKKLAVARGNAVAVQEGRHVEGDVLTAQFRDLPNGKTQLHTMTAIGHVTVVTKNDVSRADRAVYDINRNIAVLTGNVRITRPDGTQLNGDVGEVDFAANQSRLLNEGKGRVRALLSSKASPKSGSTTASANSTANIRAPSTPPLPPAP